MSSCVTAQEPGALDTHDPEALRHHIEMCLEDAEHVTLMFIDPDGTQRVYIIRTDAKTLKGIMK